MASVAVRYLEFANPLDRVEMLAEQRHWPLDRMSEHEAVMTVNGGWCNLDLSLAWRDELEMLQSTCSFDLRVPEADLTRALGERAQMAPVTDMSTRIEGRRVAVSSLVDPATRTVQVIFEVDNKDRKLRVGALAVW